MSAAMSSGLFKFCEIPGNSIELQNHIKIKQNPGEKLQKNTEESVKVYKDT